MPPPQTSGALQAPPQTPQLALSFWRSTQVPSHALSGASQPESQTPAAQSPLPHETPQSPQFSGSVRTSLQSAASPHRFFGASHVGSAGAGESSLVAHESAPIAKASAAARRLRVSWGIPG